MQLTPEMTIGLIASFGISILAILMLLKRFGVISFTGNNKCSEHTTFCDVFKSLKNEHIIYGETIKHHEKQLNDGKIIFRKIETNISEIHANIAVLLDRSEHK